MTAVEEDKILPRNPCRIRGAGTEDAGERPVLTVVPALRDHLAIFVKDEPGALVSPA
jgi:hypothetical protein